MKEIVVNKRGHRILVCDEPVWVEYDSNFSYDNFDAVFISTIFSNDVEFILKSINPVTCNKASYKPFFASIAVKDKIGIYAVMFDAFINSIDDELEVSTFEWINNYRNQYHVPKETGTITNHNMLILRIFRYYISRNHLLLEPKVMEKSAMGIAFPLAECLHSWSLFHINEYFSWIELSVAKGTLAYRKSLYHIHVCPKCQHSHLIYQEICPNCGSNNLEYEPVIHHFSCANISPEHTYMVGGQLICPKCHKTLRHIGIDYDRPASLYHCSDCDQTFLNPDTTALCTYCGTKAPVSELFPRAIHSVEITQDGIEAFCQGKFAFSPYNDYFNNFMPISAFENRLRLLVNRTFTLEGIIRGLMLAIIWVVDEKGNPVYHTDKAVEACSRLFINNKLAATSAAIYVQSTIIEGGTEGQKEEFHKLITDKASYIAMFLKKGETMNIAFKTIGNNMQESERFLQEWTILPSVVDISIKYEDVEHPEDADVMMFITQQSSKQATQDLSEKEQQKRNAELVRNEINQLQDQPLTTRMIGYLKWGYVVLAIVSLLALLFGYWTWLR